MGQFPVMLRPLDPSTKTLTLDQSSYTCRFLSQRSDQNADFEAALESLVTDMVALFDAPIRSEFRSSPCLCRQSPRSQAAR
jgi:hypothetical protein